MREKKGEKYKRKKMHNLFFELNLVVEPFINARASATSTPTVGEDLLARASATSTPTRVVLPSLFHSLMSRAGEGGGGVNTKNFGERKRGYVPQCGAGARPSRTILCFKY